MTQCMCYNLFFEAEPFAAMLRLLRMLTELTGIARNLSCLLEAPWAQKTHIVAQKWRLVPVLDPICWNHWMPLAEPLGRNPSTKHGLKNIGVAFLFYVTLLNNLWTISSRNTLMTFTNRCKQTILLFY